MHIVLRLLSFAWAASVLSVSVVGGAFFPFLPPHFLELFPKKELFTNPSPATSSSPPSSPPLLPHALRYALDLPPTRVLRCRPPRALPPLEGRHGEGCVSWVSFLPLLDPFFCSSLALLACTLRYLSLHTVFRNPNPNASPPHSIPFVRAARSPKQWASNLLGCIWGCSGVVLRCGFGVGGRGFWGG
jgi:hypothetical protein